MAAECDQKFKRAAVTYIENTPKELVFTTEGVAVVWVRPSPYRRKSSWCGGLMGYERMGVPVTGMMLKMQAQEMYQVAVADQVPSKRRRAGENTSFVVTYCHFAAVRESQSTPLDGELKPSEFSKEVRQKMQELGLSVVYNGDQTDAL
ncbi:hypothetical protein PHMEG_00026072 [Phytophthora megakarya]|uniref:Uncharacterized protein n=1 Tax=Phytophthora megakarya TaxID=4795 RepID=A0A225VC72_9STRA|nr:hypothetical protein PHMEG_00026072 [Phytophthora megakarya]